MKPLRQIDAVSAALARTKITVEPQLSYLPSPQVALKRRIAQSARRIIMSKMDSVVHFEMPYDDRERMAKFYRDAFGWQTRMLGEEMGNYVIATTTETDESGPKRPGAINGGFFARKPEWPAQHPSPVIAVDNNEATKKQD